MPGWQSEMARATKEEAQETRNRLLDAAENVFHQNGVVRTSLAEIAQAAQVTRGAIYWHFKNKDDLFDAMCERVLQPIEAAIQESADAAGSDPLGQLRASCLFVLQEAAGNPHTHKVLSILFHRCEYVEGAGVSMSRRQEAFHTGTDNIERILKNAVSRNQLPPGLDTRLAATMFHASWSGLLNNWLFSPGSFDLARDADRLVNACVDNLRGAHSLRHQ